MSGVLSGYRVLDLTDEKGAFGARLLADMGAEVIRIDRPGTVVGDNIPFMASNAGKFDITLNIETERGQQLFRRMVSAADVLVESYPPAYLTGLGLGYPQLGEINPRLIMASITGFGQSGPRRDFKLSELVCASLGGWLSVCGEEAMPPLKPYGEQAYYTAGLFAANGILLALWQRHTSGKGQHIDISIMDCVAATLDHVLVRYFYEGVVTKRQGSLYWNNAFRVFPCRDGYILLTLFYQWETLVEWLDSEGMAADLTEPSWQDEEARRQGLDHIIDVLERWTKKHDVDGLVEKGQLMRFPWAKVARIPDVVASPQLAARDFFTKMKQPEAGKIYFIPGAPVKMDRSPWRVGGRAPAIGEHNVMIYQNELGLSQAEMEELACNGVI